MEEREFFDERPEKKMATLELSRTASSRPSTRSRGLYGPRRDNCRDVPTNAIARASPRPGSYMLRKDDLMACKNMRCRKRFEISGVQSVVFTE